MSQVSTILSLKSDCQAAIELLQLRLERAGFQVQRSFDLQVARSAHVACSCPNHGTDQCDCQMVMLLVYGEGNTPVTLAIHGHDGHTQINLMETPEAPHNRQNVIAILNAICQVNNMGRKTTLQSV